MVADRTKYVCARAGLERESAMYPQVNKKEAGWLPCSQGEAFHNMTRRRSVEVEGHRGGLARQEVRGLSVVGGPLWQKLRLGIECSQRGACVGGAGRPEERACELDWTIRPIASLCSRDDDAEKIYSSVRGKQTGDASGEELFMYLRTAALSVRWCISPLEFLMFDPALINGVFKSALLIPKNVTLHISHVAQRLRDNANSRRTP